MGHHFSSIRICIIACFLTLLFGCKNHENTVKESTLVFEKEKAISLSETDFFKNKLIIPLETVDNSLVNRNPAIKKDKENIFIYSQYSHYPVLRFDINGSFLNQIGSVGNGPNEYTEVEGIVINETESSIEVLSRQSILSFTYDGSFIKREKIEFPAFSFTKVNNYYWFCVGNNRGYSEHRVLQTDLNFNITNRYLADNSDLWPISESNFQQSPYHTFRETFFNKIYRIENDTLCLSYDVKVPDLELPSEVHKVPLMEMGDYLKQHSYATILHYLENDTYTYMMITEYNNNRAASTYHWIINKTNGKNIIIKPEQLIEGAYLFSPQVLTEDDSLYFLGYLIEKEDDSADFDLNPSIVVVNLASIK